MKTFIFLIAFFFVSILAFGQGVTIGTNNPPDPSAALDLQSTNKGFLHSRMTTSQRNAIVSPALGLQIFNTTTNCLEVYLPLSGWKVVACDCQSGPSSAFTFPNQIGQGIPATFTATTPGMNYAWTFQSGTPASSSQQTENVTWAVAGTYTVTLTVTDNAGCSSTTTQSITVTTCPPFGSNSVTFSYTGGLQTFTVPNTCAGIIRILALGGQGGNSSAEGSRIGGMGASIQGDFVVTPGQTITLLVGGKGTNGGCGGGGGGGSFAVSNGSLMVAAGGGGGAMICNYNSSVGGDGFPGLTTQNGGNGGAGNCYNNGFAAPIGGINGLGGGLGSSGYGGGGGGYLGAGASGNSNGGGAYPGAGGSGGASGGYGGGGAGYMFCCGSAGGGGGYSGGAGGNECSPGGGGGSFNAGTNPVNQQGIQSGNGQIVITY